MEIIHIVMGRPHWQPWLDDDLIPIRAFREYDAALVFIGRCVEYEKKNPRHLATSEAQKQWAEAHPAFPNYHNVDHYSVVPLELE